jgi:hypothetical protein
MTAPPKAADSNASEERGSLVGLFATERDILAKRIADAPAMWISIPMWGRVFTIGRKLLGLDRRAGGKK